MTARRRVRPRDKLTVSVALVVGVVFELARSELLDRLAQAARVPELERRIESLDDRVERLHSLNRKTTTDGEGQDRR